MKEKAGRAARAKIVAASRELFAEKGFRHATVREIARKAGVNGAAVNYYFSSKEALYEAVFEEAYERFGRPLADLPPAVRDDASWLGAVGKWYGFMLSLFLLDDPELAVFRRLVARERSSPTEQCRRLYEDVFLPVVDVFRTLMRMALPDAPEPEFRAAFATCLGMCTCFMHREPPWDDLEVCPSVPREKWVELLRDEILASIHSRFRFRENQLYS